MLSGMEKNILKSLNLLSILLSIGWSILCISASLTHYGIQAALPVPGMIVVLIRAIRWHIAHESPYPARGIVDGIALAALGAVLLASGVFHG